MLTSFGGHWSASQSSLTMVVSPKLHHVDIFSQSLLAASHSHCWQPKAPQSRCWHLLTISIQHLLHFLLYRMVDDHGCSQAEVTTCLCPRQRITTFLWGTHSCSAAGNVAIVVIVVIIVIVVVVAVMLLTTCLCLGRWTPRCPLSPSCPAETLVRDTRLKSAECQAFLCRRKIDPDLEVSL